MLFSVIISIRFIFRLGTYENIDSNEPMTSGKQFDSNPKESTLSRIQIWCPVYQKAPPQLICLCRQSSGMTRHCSLGFVTETKATVGMSWIPDLFLRLEMQNQLVRPIADFCPRWVICAQNELIKTQLFYLLRW